MNSVSFFYNIFINQELILKLNILDLKKQCNLKKCIIFKPNDIDNNSKALSNVNNDLRYLFEFLTNTKIIKAINNNFVTKLLLNKNKCHELFIYFSYLIFSRSNFVLESKIFEYSYPILEKPNKIEDLTSKRQKNFFDIHFRNGLNLPFLSDNEYISWLSADFYIRFIFKRSLTKDLFFELKQKLYLSLCGLKFILIHNNYKKKN